MVRMTTMRTAVIAPTTSVPAPTTPEAIELAPPSDNAFLTWLTMWYCRLR